MENSFYCRTPGTLRLTPRPTPSPSSAPRAVPLRYQGITLLQDAGTSDDSGRASERLTGSSVAPRDPDSSRDRLSDCDSEDDDEKAINLIMPREEVAETARCENIVLPADTTRFTRARRSGRARYTRPRAAAALTRSDSTRAICTWSSIMPPL
ncbi:hypothetical protein EVAR_20504_1 [Eumeta japonica]|uniref:Uncharacterized protein n=1 Tax=Eumeta variegata TaxID=151549 RepID=A0A4C1VLT0_EUMVA|nr:hypothetical protein EVAR_20504_1 [Eumeta japonica]